MMRAQNGLAAAIVVLSIAAGSTATADPIRITSGTLDIAGLDPVFYRPATLHLEGERGFTLDAVTGDGSFGLGLDCLFGCNPGDVVSLDATWAGLDLIGTAALDGRSYDHIGGLLDVASAAVVFEACAKVPDSFADVVSVTVPFSFSGIFGHESGFESLVGRGTVTATFEHPLVPDEGFYQPQRTVYTFVSSVVPEPGTIVLVGTGLLATARAARSRRRKRG